jgi:RNA polymerase subunit RPABC4/transcription elongation factor Spt4
MNLIALFFGLVLLAISIFYVIRPFRSSNRLKKSASPAIPQKSSLKSPFEKQHQAALLALRDLDFDHQAGKVAEEDYHPLRLALLNEVAQLMQSQERQREDAIEALIQSRRQAASNGQAMSSTGTHCQYCRAPLLEKAKFCTKCGKPVSEPACPECKELLLPGDKFCPACGTTVKY